MLALTLSDIPRIALLVLVIVVSFNLIIFVHELGHFLAGRWRGLKIDRFQIWFGKPIWKRTWNGVQYGLGWIPFGGFVSLPQMAPMQAIEGNVDDGEAPLPPISPLDKIIVAFAGPLFSLLLALSAGLVVSAIGTPSDLIPSTRIGSVSKDMPGAKAGLRPGDQVLAINDEPVSSYAGSGNMDGIFERIILSKGDEIRFKIQRDGEPEPRVLTSKFEIEPTKWYQRRSLRHVGVGPEADYVQIASVTEGSPADRAGLKAGDRLIKADGKPVICASRFLEIIAETETRPFEIVYERPPEGTPAEVTSSQDAKKIPLTPGTVTLQAEVPESPAGKPPMIGVLPDDVPFQISKIVYPSAWEQVGDSLNKMWTTLNRLISRDSSINIDHLSGAVGIAKVQYQILQMDHPANRMLAFFVLFNVNLAVLNMLPLPVLDGGHIVLALMEWAARRPVKAKVLEWVQTAFAVMLLSLMLYVTSKDLFGDMGKDKAAEKYVWKAH